MLSYPDIEYLILNMDCYITFYKFTNNSPICYGDLDYGCVFCYTLTMKEVALKNLYNY